MDEITPATGQTSTDIPAMIRWLARQGNNEALYRFTIACCRRIWGELPEPCQRVVEHAERVGVHDIDDVLADASKAIAKLERQFHKSADETEQARLSRQIGFARMVFAFEFQDVSEMAGSISNDLIAWAKDPAAERSVQADLLRDCADDGQYE
ncbi:MAG TPA: hypothetical protein VFE47_11255 [Tepidisphaeraceae bacterium]|nr:hypothetical protein [Tepidisphaeraceae bacterium]